MPSSHIRHDGEWKTKTLANMKKRSGVGVSLLFKAPEGIINITGYSSSLSAARER
jgi:hypothetical protein